MKKGVLLVILVLLILPLVIAPDTTISIKTQPDKEVTARLLNPQSGKIIDNAIFQLTSNAEGLAKFTYSGIYSIMRMSVTVKGIEFDGRPTIFLPSFNGGKELFLDLTSSSPSVQEVKSIETQQKEETNTKEVIVEISEEDLVEEETTDEESADIKEKSEDEIEKETKEKDLDVFSITGKVIEENAFVRSTGTIVIIVIILLVISLGVLYTLKKKKPQMTREEIDLEDAEQRIKKAEEEISNIKKRKEDLKNAQTKYEQDKMRFEEDRKRLEELKKDEQ